MIAESFYHRVVSLLLSDPLPSGMGVTLGSTDADFVQKGAWKLYIEKHGLHFVCRRGQLTVAVTVETLGRGEVLRW